MINFVRKEAFDEYGVVMVDVVEILVGDCDFLICAFRFPLFDFRFCLEHSRGVDGAESFSALDRAIFIWGRKVPWKLQFQFGGISPTSANQSRSTKKRSNTMMHRVGTWMTILRKLYY